MKDKSAEINLLIEGEFIEQLENSNIPNVSLALAARVVQQIKQIKNNKKD